MDPPFASLLSQGVFRVKSLNLNLSKNLDRFI